MRYRFCLGLDHRFSRPFGRGVMQEFMGHFVDPAAGAALTGRHLFSPGSSDSTDPEGATVAENVPSSRRKDSVQPSLAQAAWTIDSPRP